MTVASINKKQKPLLYFPILGILLFLAHELNLVADSVDQPQDRSNSGSNINGRSDNVQVTTLLGVQQDLRFDSYIQSPNSVTGRGTEGILLDWRERDNSTRLQHTNQSQCESNLVGDFDCDGIADPCPAFTCIQ
jgi:hypothetical protein